jgi:hypothetical protein
VIACYENSVRPAMSWSMATGLLFDCFIAVLAKDGRLAAFEMPGTFRNDAYTALRSTCVLNKGGLDIAALAATLFFLRDDLKKARGTRLDAERMFARRLRELMDRASDQDFADWVVADGARFLNVFTGERELIEPHFIRDQIRIFRELLDWCCLRAPGYALPLR